MRFVASVLQSYFLSVCLFLASCSNSGGTKKGAVKDPVKEIRKPAPVSLYEKYKNSPVKIDTAYLIGAGSEISLKVTMKNKSEKKVAAVRFGYSLYNGFGDNVSGGLGYIYDTWEEPISPNKKAGFIISQVRPAKTVKNAFVDKVHFTDGTTWEADH